MNKTVEPLLNRVENFVREQLRNRLSEKMYFHNLEHTLLVVEGVQIIGNAIGLLEEEKLVVILAAFLHDVGYTEKYAGHEEASANIATAFLMQNGFDAKRTEMVRNCILATKFPQNPTNELEAVICDADFFHFSLKNYQDYASRLKAEWKENLDLEYSQLAWDKLNLHMLQQHEYFTTFGKTVLQEKKADNISLLLKRIT